MKKIIVFTLVALLIFSIFMAVFAQNKFTITFIVFAVIDVSAIFVLLYSLAHDKKVRKNEKTESLILQAQRDEILSLCQMITINHKTQLANELVKELNKGDSAFLEEWATKRIATFIQKEVLPSIRQSLPKTDYKEILNLSDEMNMIVFKTAFESINADIVPPGLLEKINISPS